MPRKSVSTNDALIQKYAEKQKSIKAQRELLKSLTDDLKALEQQLINSYNVPDGQITTLENKDYTIKINRTKKRKNLTVKQITELIQEQLGNDSKGKELLKEIEEGNGERESLHVAVRSRDK